MIINSNDCIAKALECRERAVRATSEEVRAELLQLATAWMGLGEELTRRQDLLSAPAEAMNRVKQCLAHAEMCRALAAQAIHPRRKAKLLELASRWVSMAENA